MLRQRGYDSECVENGLEAVNIAASKEYDLVLMVIYANNIF
jgi:CheY-like chemotaxis protein